MTALARAELDVVAGLTVLGSNESKETVSKFDSLYICRVLGYDVL